MSPEEFIRKNLVDHLVKSGTPAGSAYSLAEEGLRYWRESARFKKSAWVDTLAYVKNRARGNK